MFELLSCLARTGSPDALVVQLAKEQDLLQDFEFLQALAAKMTVADFSARVTTAFFL